MVVPSLSASQAWAAIAAFVVVHELFCEEEHLLSRGYDRGLDLSPELVYGATALVVAHLLNLIPPKVDPISWIHLAHQHITKGKNGRPICNSSRRY